VADERDDYQVGYGKPPKERQFKKGISGNRKGRPKGSKNLATLLNEIASELIPLTEGGKSMKVTRLEGVLRIQMNSALKGDHRAIKDTVQMYRAFELEQIGEEHTSVPHERDEMAMKRILKRMQQNHTALPTTVTTNSTSEIV
jgi:Family of unknown function (DUF5681)